MDRLAAPARQARRSRTWRVLAVVAALLALSAGAAGLARQSDPAGRAPHSSRDGDAQPGTTPAPPATASRPTSIRIDSIDVSATVRPMGIKPDQNVEVPDDPDNVGWYSLGTVPGEAGSAVLLGHVDSTHGPAVFARLRSLAVGAKVAVVAADGSTTRFEVTRSATYANDDFPARTVYRTTGRPRIALVTCGGRYDASRGGYQANVVVYASLVGSTPSTPRA